MMKTVHEYRYDTIYKRGSKGEVRAWRKELGFDPDTSEWGHRTVSGIHEGSMTASGWSVAKPKNVGRSNETSSHTQAKAENEADYTKKLDRGYFEDIDKIDEVLFTKPMLAVDWDKRKGKLGDEKLFFVQPKLDGIRCIARADGLWSRSGKPINSCEHIEEQLAELFRYDPTLVIDGELYNHGLRDDFNTITSIVRKETQDEEKKAQARALIEYHVYDIASSTKVFSARNEQLARLMELIPGSDSIKLVPTYLANTREQIDSLYGNIIGEGYEGAMVRLNGKYKHGGRSNDLLKRKDFITEEFPVLEVTEGQGNWAGYAKQMVIELPDGRQCGSGIRGSQAKMKDLLEGNKPDWATVRYFELTPDGVPRFPVVIDYGIGERGD